MCLKVNTTGFNKWIYVIYKPFRKQLPTILNLSSDITQSSGGYPQIFREPRDWPTPSFDDVPHTLLGVSSLVKMATVQWERTISEDCEIEFVVLECDIDAVDNENHSVDYLGIETYQFEPETLSDCTVSASDSVNNTYTVNRLGTDTTESDSDGAGKVSTSSSRLVQLDYKMCK